MNLKFLYIFFLMYFNVINSMDTNLSIENLYEILDKNNLKDIKKILEKIDIDIQDRNNQTVLFWAVCENNEQKVNLILSLGANPNIQDKKGFTAIMYSHNNINITKLLITYGADINVQNNSKETFLLRASRLQNYPIVKFLLESGADVNLADESARVPLMYIQDEEILKFLISKGAILNSRNNRGSTPLIKQCEKNSDIKIIEILVNSGAEINIQNDAGITALFCASSNSLDVVKFLLSKGANPNLIAKHDVSCLAYAISHLNYEIIKILLDWDADINIKNVHGKSIIDYAQNDSRIINLLNSIINSWKMILFNAIKDNNYNLFKKYLLKLGSICIKDNNGNNLLHYAIKSGNLEFTKIIVYLKPELVYQENNNGETPLSFACSNLDILKFVNDNLLTQ